MIDAQSPGTHTRDWLLLLVVVTATLVAALGLIRWIAPGLLGVPSDLQLVSVDRKVPPFYENVFRAGDFSSAELLIKDPLTRIRPRPLLPRNILLGPHDILGFRNLAIPNVADVVTIGDSITYGNNAWMEDNWPGAMMTALGSNRATLYNMSAGGWGAVQYLDMFSNATLFQPRVIVVAFYTGNDPLDSFIMVYGNDSWRALIPDPNLDKADAPHVVFPAPESEWWPVTFSDGIRTIFTPELRLTSNQDHPAIRAGYEIMATVAEKMAGMSAALPVQLVFTVVPTKELVYADKVAQEGLVAPDSYRQLVDQESEHINWLVARLKDLPGTSYVDVIRPLQENALRPVQLYLEDINGHPTTAGYALIGRTIAQHVTGLLPERLIGRVALRKGDYYTFLLVTDAGYRDFQNSDIMQQNGWPDGSADQIQPRDLAGLRYLGVVTTVDPARFGPVIAVQTE